MEQLLEEKRQLQVSLNLELWVWAKALWGPWKSFHPLQKDVEHTSSYLTAQHSFGHELC